ncbi:MAG: translation initiation factor IF-2 [Alphaproteobacteria bacterium]|nr:translation initiation factor IF-2 [Alphaproteobacteria bacterium]
MTDATDEQQGKKPLTLSRPGRLELKKTVESGQIRQSFSHGRSKAVRVEVKKKRTYAPGDGGRMTEVKPGAEVAAEQALAGGAKAAVTARAGETAREAELRALTEQEKATRARALEGAIRAGEQVRKEAEEEKIARVEEELRAKAADVVPETVIGKAPAPEPEEPEEVKEEAGEVTGETAPAAEPAPDGRAAEKLKAPPVSAKAIEEAAAEEALEKRPKRGGRSEARRPSLSLRRDVERRRGGKLTIARALDDDAHERVRSLASVRRQRERERRAQQAATPVELVKVVRDVVIPESITVQELSNRMAERGTEVIKALMKMDVMATINQTIDGDTAELLVAEFGHNVKRVSESDVEVGLEGAPDTEESLKPRAPVVTIMGHVDHGKTSLLDSLRQTDVASHEAGGITQHIGAYRVELKSGNHITFLDTPGHEAFTAMRSRGAKVTDIVVLVVAADDGVKPQTVEAIHHAKAAEVPIIVAINKIDKPGADTDKVRQELLQHEIVLESMGGEVLAVEVSAKEGTNLDKLEEMILLQSEILELKANPDRPADGVVVEAKIERGRGNVATVLVQRGTLRIGDVFVAGREWGHVRALIDDRGRKVEEADSSMPVEVLGLNGTPLAGDEFTVVENEARARQVTEFRQRSLRDARAAIGARGTVEQLLLKIADGGLSELPVIVKTDVHGTLEAIIGAFEKFSTDEVAVQVLHSAVGGINESDVTLANTTDALIVGFNVRANPQARDLARRDNVEIRYYSVIYDLTDDIKAALSGMLSPTIKESLLGNAEIREVFSVTKVGKVAGCMVTEGLVKRGAKVRLLRDSIVIHEGSLKSLKRFKDEVREVKEGFECGMAFENYQDIQAADVIECFEIEEIARTL